MSFAKKNVTFMRGIMNANTPPTGIVRHFYTTDTDDFTAIEVAGYFPNFLGGTKDNVKDGDLFEVQDVTKSYKRYAIITENPISILEESISGGNLVSGPVTSSTNAVAVWSDTTGATLKDSTLTVTGNNVNTPGIISSDTLMVSPNGIRFAGASVLNRFENIVGNVSIIGIVSGSMDFRVNLIGGAQLGQTRVNFIFQNISGANDLAAPLNTGVFLSAQYRPAFDVFLGYVPLDIAALKGQCGIIVHSDGTMTFYDSAQTGALNPFPGSSAATTITGSSFSWTN